MNVNSETRPVILGLLGPVLTDAEKQFFGEADPFGFILFQRNCETPAQVLALCRSLRDAVGRSDAPVLIDQEGGRVQRLRAPHWREAPPAREIGRLAESDLAKGKRAAFLHAQYIAIQMRACGVTVNCAPCLDLSIPGAHGVIGDRSYGADPLLVQSLGREACAGYFSAGVTPVIKHLPGHGRASVDSHHALPVIDTGRETMETSDFEAFRDQPAGVWGMTGHLSLNTVDPENCTTFSRQCIESVIRESIGFDGLLLSDDLSMKALDGEIGGRARRALDAGCDIALHCNGDMVEMETVCAASPAFSDAAKRRIGTVELPSATVSLDAAGRELNALIG